MDSTKFGTNLPIVINGAGPVGLTMACELARHGVPLRIFDKNSEPAAQSRALAIFPRTLEVFQMIGILDQVLAEGQRIHAVSMYNDSRQLARLNLDHVESPYPFAIGLPQSRTERLLQARLESLGAHVERQMELIALDQDTASIRARYRRADGTEETVEGSWMLGCDGAHSAVRHLTGMTFQGAPYEEEFLLADVKIDTDLPTDEAHLFLSSHGLFAYFPFRDGRGRIIATQLPDAKHISAEPTLEELREMVKSRCFHRLEVSDPVWQAWFRISHRMVAHYSAGRAFLAGDAAHIHSPAGGQGMNTGIQDAVNLAWKLALVTRGLAVPGLLDSYEAERMPVARSVVNLTDRMTRVATAQNPATQHLRDMLLPMLTGIPFLKDAMAGRMAEVSIDYRGTPWIENHGPGPLQAGDRAPDAPLFDRNSNKACNLYDLLKNPGFLLLTFGQSDVPAALLGNLPGKVYRITRPGQQTAPATLEDRDCRAHAIYGAEEAPLLFLIRPDGYIAFKGATPAELTRYLGETFNPQAPIS